MDPQPPSAPQGYGAEILRQRAIWQAKPVLRILYTRWYAAMVAALAAGGPTVEIGAGSGNFAAFHPGTIATDFTITGPWIDRAVDAHELAFAASSLANIVAFDVIHHLQRPLAFLRQAAKALRPGGRLVLCEPAVTPWSRLVYAFHHEALDTGWDLFACDGQPPDPDPLHTFANMAIAHLLFRRHAARTAALVPELRVVRREAGDFLLYPLSGGFSYRCLVPELGLGLLLRLERALTRPCASWLTGLRQLIVLERIVD